MCLTIRTDKTGLTMAEVAPFLGLHHQVYGRYVRNETPIQVSRLIHLSEVLDFSPVSVEPELTTALWQNAFVKEMK